MKWGAIIGITVVSAMMVIYELPKLTQNQKKEKMAVLTLIAIGWILAVLLNVYRDLPGPTQLIDTIYQPLVRFLEK